MRRNYGQAHRGSANVRKNAGNARRGAHAENRGSAGRGSAGRGSRANMRRAPQPKKNNNQGVLIGVLVGCAAIILIVVVVAMNTGGSGETIGEKLQPDEPKVYEPDKAKGSVQNNSSTNKSDEVVSNDPMGSDNDDEEEDFDDDDDWSKKDPDFKGEKFKGREGFGK